MTQEKITKLPKPKRGQCGTCNWFEVWPGNPDAGMPLQGSCVVNPPQPQIQTMQVKPSALVDPTKAQQAQYAQSVTGIVPPTNELRRCGQWRPAGMQPPFDDFIRPGFRRVDIDTELKEQDETKQ